MLKRCISVGVRQGFVGLLVFSFALLVLAQSSPTTSTYQGRLTDNTPGQTPINTTVSITFTIHDHPTNDNPVWTESWPTVTVNNGIFSVLLGSNGTPLPDSIFRTTPTLYLELVINGEILSPRQQLGSVGFAQVAVHADGSDSANDLTCADCVESGEVNFNYAGSASEGGAATDLDCSDCVTDAEVNDVISVNNGLLYALGGGGGVGIGTVTPSLNFRLDVVGFAGGIRAEGPYVGIFGEATSSGITRYGVMGDGNYLPGDTFSDPSVGIWGEDAFYGVYGEGFHTGVYGYARTDGLDPRYGVYGEVAGSTGSTYGVFGTSYYVGVQGLATGTGTRFGVYGDGNGSVGTSYGVIGINATVGVSGTGTLYGVAATGQARGVSAYVHTDSPRYGVFSDGGGTGGTSHALHGENADIGVYATGSSQAGYFSGEVFVNRNSSTTEPHLELYESGSGDYARIKFRQAGSSNYFDIAASPNNTASSGWLNFFSSAYGDTLRIRGDGYVYLTRLGSYSNTLCVSSTGGGYIGNCSSSGQYKTNIHPLALGLETVLRLNPVLFDWKEDGTSDLGFVAEEVAGIDPVLTTTNADGDPEGVRYRQLTAVLTNAIQEQQALIEKQQALLDELSQRVAELEAQQQ